MTTPVLVTPASRAAAIEKLREMNVQTRSDCTIGEIAEKVARAMKKDVPTSLTEAASMILQFVNPCPLGALRVRPFVPLASYLKDRGMREALERTAAARPTRIHGEFMGVGA